MVTSAVTTRDYPPDPGICSLDECDLYDRKLADRSFLLLSGSKGWFRIGGEVMKTSNWTKKKCTFI